MSSFYGYVTLTRRGEYLLGGTQHHKSVRFEAREDASAWVAQCVAANCTAGRLPTAWGVVATDYDPELAHAAIRGAQEDHSDA